MEEWLNPLSRPPGTRGPGTGGARGALDVRGQPLLPPELLCFIFVFLMSSDVCSIWIHLLFTIKKRREEGLPE